MTRSRLYCIRIALALAATATLGSAHADTLAHLDALQREMRIAEDVIEAALGNVPNMRVSDVEADYLAGQGVLISLSVRTGWLGSAHGQRVVKIIRNEAISMPVPDMVHEILADLDLDLPTLGGHPPNLEALRELRGQQRQLRAQQRKVRQRIWDARFQMARTEETPAAGGTDFREKYEREVAALEEELRRLEAEDDALEARIDAEYEQLTSVSNVEEVEFSRVPEEAPGEADFDAALVQTLCDYGATFKSLPQDEHLSVRVRRYGGDAFRVFRFEDVVACQRGGTSPDELMAKATAYED